MLRATLSMPFFVPFLSLNDYSQTAESLVDCFVVGKILSHIGINNHDIGSFRISIRIFSPHSSINPISLKSWMSKYTSGLTGSQKPAHLPLETS